MKKMIQDNYEWIEFESRNDAADFFKRQAEKLNIPKHFIKTGFVSIDSDISNSHNYEIEYDCYEYFRIFSVIMEPCPRNGLFCKFGEFCSMGRDLFNKYMINHIKEIIME